MVLMKMFLACTCSMVHTSLLLGSSALFRRGGHDMTAFVCARTRDACSFDGLSVSGSCF